MGARRTPPRELVSFGRHKLRRLSTSFSRTSKDHTLQARVLLLSVLFSVIQSIYSTQFFFNEFTMTKALMSCQPNAYLWKMTLHG